MNFLTEWAILFVFYIGTYAIVSAIWDIVKATYRTFKIKRLKKVIAKETKAKEEAIEAKSQALVQATQDLQNEMKVLQSQMTLLKHEMREDK